MSSTVDSPKNRINFKSTAAGSITTYTERQKTRLTKTNAHILYHETKFVPRVIFTFRTIVIMTSGRWGLGGIALLFVIVLYVCLNINNTYVSY